MDIIDRRYRKIGPFRRPNRIKRIVKYDCLRFFGSEKAKGLFKDVRFVFTVAYLADK